MEEENTKRSNTSVIIFLVFLTVIIGLIISKKNQKVINYNQSTIGYTSRIEQYGKHSCLRYYFYVDSTKILSKNSKSSENYLHKFYVVKYDGNNPNENFIVLDREINPDSLSLVNAGFKKKKIYTYDPIKSNYKEKIKWQ
jgi:hypothetical protein